MVSLHHIHPTYFSHKSHKEPFEGEDLGGGDWKSLAFFCGGVSNTMFFGVELFVVEVDRLPILPEDPRHNIVQQITSLVEAIFQSPSLLLDPTS